MGTIFVNPDLPTFAHLEAMRDVTEGATSMLRTHGRPTTQKGRQYQALLFLVAMAST